MRIITCTILILLNFSCMSDTTIYEYADGNGNVYILTSSSLEYVPVKKEKSSSGSYSGGSPKKITITSTQYKSIKDLLDAALENTSIHIKDRVMMSGVVRISGSQANQSCIIKPGSEELSRIEKVLKITLEGK